MLDHVPAMIFWFDVNMRYRFVNEHYERVYKVERTELIGRHLSEVTGENTFEKVSHFVDRVQTGETVRFECILPVKDDEPFRNVEVTLVPELDPKGTVNGILALLTDITERKVLEEQTRRAERMGVVSRLTGGLAHEFNNILAIILGNFELALMKLGPDHPILNHLTAISDSANRAVRLTKHMLGFSRQLTLTPRSVDLSLVVRARRNDIEATIGEAVELRIHSESDLWLAFVDAQEFETTLLNLCLNAGDAMPDGGSLRIELSNESIEVVDSRRQGELAPGDYVKVEFIDEGSGISEHLMPHVFEPFFTTKDVGDGTGLGLSMVYGFVTQSNGYVSIQSGVGQGVTVTILLPRSVARGSQ